LIKIKELPLETHEKGLSTILVNGKEPTPKKII